MHVAVAVLPGSLRSALAELGYKRESIEVTPSETYSLGGSAGNGSRNIGAAVNLETGERVVKVGSWGGANPFERRQADLDTASRSIPTNGAYIYASEGGGRPVYAHVYVHPAAMPAQLEADPTEGATLHELFALVCIVGLTSAGRRDAFERERYNRNAISDIGVFSAANPAVAGVIARGWATANKAGAVTATIAGKNAREAARKKLSAAGIYTH